MRKLFKTLIILVVLVAVAGALYALARSNKGDKDGVKQVTIETGSITEKAIAVGQIQPRQKFSIKSKLSGHRQELPRQRGGPGAGRRRALRDRARTRPRRS